MPRYFTLEEANRTLDEIRPLMDEIQSIRKTILDNQPEAWPAIQQAAGNGGGHAASLLALGVARLDDLMHAIQATGALIKDINTGLLDFPALRAGHEVYLCWRYGEPRIDYWHEIEAGFAGRKPIDRF